MRQLTAGSASSGQPLWSDDGEWIFFVSHDAGVWKVSATSGEPVATDLARIGPRSADGKHVFWTEGISPDFVLWMAPIGGGNPTRVFDSVARREFAVTSDGIYYIRSEQDSNDLFWNLSFYEFSSGATSSLAPVKVGTGTGLDVSPDGRTVAYTQSDEGGRRPYAGFRLPLRGGPREDLPASYYAYTLRVDQKNLFSRPEGAIDAASPLAERVRPRDLDELIGQEEIAGPNTALATAIEKDVVGSLILWGPPAPARPPSLASSRIVPNRTSSCSALSSPASKRSKRSCRRPSTSETCTDVARCCSSMRFTASTKPNKMRSCLTSSPAT